MLRETRITIALSKGINDISIVSLFAAEITAIIRSSFPRTSLFKPKCVEFVE